MPRSLGKDPIGYSQRSGKKVRYSDLVEDGNIRGLIVAKDEFDPEHPQKFARVVGTDRIALTKPMPEAAAGPVNVMVGYESSSDLWTGRIGIAAISLSIGGFVVPNDFFGTAEAMLVSESEGLAIDFTDETQVTTGQFLLYGSAYIKSL